ncbi:hypothetical protein [Croceicoccus marinus]|uniref:hypothetical protein n=1 Tax=Croceicoccus marinus TaxID=450378 RepID=UPI0012FA043C|nr:hypothetical protein [Croceicoccus marinus]
MQYNDWDDWFTFETKFCVVYFDADGSYHHLGWVKIGFEGQTKKFRRTPLPKTFETLPDGYFSVGLSGDYYTDIYNLGISSEYFSAMKDMAFDLGIYERFKDEDVATTSLFRSLDQSRLESRYHRLALGDAELTPYDFTYAFPP